MTIQTTIGKTYAVTSAAECTVTTPEGILIATCPAGEQTLFVAPTTEIEISDDAALVTESFKGAPAGLSAVWGSIKKVSALWLPSLMFPRSTRIKLILLSTLRLKSVRSGTASRIT